MQTVESRRSLQAGRLISGLAVAFLIVDSVGKLPRVQPVIDGTRQLGYSPEVVFGLGLTLLCCVLVYIVVSAASLEDAGRWAVQYIDAVGADEVDLRELE